jgi:hypothetical protein
MNLKKGVSVRQKPLSQGLIDPEFVADNLCVKSKYYISVGYPTFLFSPSLKPDWGVDVSEDEGQNIKKIQFKRSASAAAGFARK